MVKSQKMLMEKEGELGWITFNQPEKRNAVSQEMWQMIPVVFQRWCDLKVAISRL